MTKNRHQPQPQPARAWRWALPIILASITAAACSTVLGSSCASGSAADRSTPPSVASPPSSASQETTASEAATARTTPRPSSAITSVKVTVGDQSFIAELYDNPTAHDLAGQLPVTLIVNDLNGLEKTGRLPRALTIEGVPSGSDPEPNEIGYYAPGRDLVLYYGDVGYYDGIIRIGRFDTAINRIADQPDGTTVTVERT